MLADTVSSTIDNDRYSRQSYSIGQDLMCKLSKASVLVIGYSTLSLEIIKNLALLGIQKISIHANSTLENWQKTGMYYNCEKGLPLDELKKLNPTITIEQVSVYDSDGEIEVKQIKQYNIIIFTNGNFEEALSLNRLTHKLKIPFIMTGAYGLMGYLFNDWGDKFTVSDVDGEVYENLLIQSVEGKIIKFKDGHNLSDRDILIAEILNPDDTSTKIEYLVKETKSPLIIEMSEIPEQNVKLYKSLIKKKIPKEITFKSLKMNYQTTTIDAVMADYSLGFTRSQDLHELHLAYSQYVEANGESPRPWSNVDFEIFTQYIKSWDTKPESWKILAKKFCFTTRGVVLPFVSIIGSVVAHEVLKALGHKYIPIVQWYYLDYYELIEDHEVVNFKDINAKRYRTTNKYEGLVNVFGKELLESVQKVRPFIVGSGAIGCELVKNLGMMGVKQMVLTDMDHIEKSNLSRQFLFNDSDILQSKAQTAAKKIKLMNSDVDVQVYEMKVCPETENTFNSEFYSKIGSILNALDNQDARIYVDQQAIKYSLPLIDSGTTGGKGNVQIVIPKLTDSYGSTKDPDDKVGIPICTIKTFPFKVAHTVQWARELFETEFSELPNLIHKYSSEMSLETTTPTEIESICKKLYKYRNFNLDSKSVHAVLSHMFVENFDYSIKKILEKYSDPEKSSELEGKVLPRLVDWTCQSTRINDFMVAGFEIFSQMFNTKFEYVPEIMCNITPEIFDIDYEKLTGLSCEFANSILKVLAPTIRKVDFEKDDDKLKHVHWLLCASNIRNYQYKIPESDLFDVRKIAGNIIPAMITTTALVSGFQILEYIKIVKFYVMSDKSKLNVEHWKNRFVNLNINYIDGITPSLAPVVQIGKLKLSLWDKILVSTNSVAKIMEHVLTITGKKVEYMMQGNEVIYDGDIVHKEYCDVEKLNLVCLVEDIEIEIPIYWFK
jgi:ubiquitin-activating enzyme E1